MNVRGLRYVLMEEANGGEGASSGAGAAGTGGADGAGAGSAGAGAAGDAAGGAGGAGGAGAGSALAAGAQGSASGAAGGNGQPAAGSPWGVIPEKFQVKNEDGTPNLEASWSKVEEHRAHLERRLGAGDLPPKAATDYKVTVPEAYAEAINADELAKSERFVEFRDEMHKAGLSQSQFDQVVGKMIDYSMKLQQGMAALSEQECMTSLLEAYGSEAARTTALQQAYRAAKAYGDVDKVLAKYGNDPDVIQLLAKAGKELSEDAPAQGATGGGALDDAAVESLQKSPAYWQQNHPDHAATKAKVDAHFRAKFGDGPKRSNGLAMTSAL